MAPLLKTDHQPAVSLLLVKPSAATIQPTLTDQGTSRQDLMQMIYTLMLLIGKNMSEIQMVYAQNQLEQDKIAENQAHATQSQTTKYMDELQTLQQKQAEAKKWEEFGEVMKWVGVAVGIALGALLCETPLGFMMIAAVIAFTASPLFNKAVDALGGAIGKAIGNSTWGNIIAQVIILVVLTVATCGAEGLSTGLSKLATTAAEDAVEGGTQAAVQAAREVSEEVAEEVTEEISEDAASQASEGAEKASSKVSIKDFKPRWSYASASVMTTTLTSSNLTGELISQVIERLPLDKNSKKLAETILTIALDLVIMIASFRAASSTGNLMQQASKLTGQTAFKIGLGSLIGATQFATGMAQGGKGYNQYRQGQILEELAPLQANIDFGQGFFQILTQLASLAQQTYKSLMETDRIIFNTNFSADWQACVQAQYQG